MRIVNPIAVLGENIAVSYLQKKGYRILERNYGEIDIVAISNQTLVFVEVKGELLRNLAVRLKQFLLGRYNHS